MNEKKVLYFKDACTKFLQFTSNRADSRDQEWSEGMGGLHNGGRGENEGRVEGEGVRKGHLDTNSTVYWLHFGRWSSHELKSRMKQFFINLFFGCVIKTPRVKGHSASYFFQKDEEN